MPKASQKYLFLHRSEPAAGPERRQPSPAEMQAMFAAWNAWKEKFKDHLVDAGDKLKPGGKLVRATGISDGPLVEAKEIIGGYMIVAAESLEEAASIAREMPSMPGASVEIREMAGAKF
jgi:hypothetical protein